MLFLGGRDGLFLLRGLVSSFGMLMIVMTVLLLLRRRRMMSVTRVKKRSRRRNERKVRKVGKVTLDLLQCSQIYNNIIHPSLIVMIAAVTQFRFCESKK